MATRIVRIGNALIVEIPGDLAARASLFPGDTVEWVANAGGGITLAKQSNPAPRSISQMTLEELLEGIPEGTKVHEYEWGPDRGAEILPEY